MFFNRKKEEEEHESVQKKNFDEHLAAIREGAQGPGGYEQKSDVQGLNEAIARHEEPTVSLKMTPAEMRADLYAHNFLIEQVTARIAQLGLPGHIAQAEAQRLLAPHWQRANDIAGVLKQIDEGQA